MKSHQIYWDLTRSTKISQDLLRSHTAYWFNKIQLTFDIWTFTFYIWHLTLTCHLTFDTYWDLTRSTDLALYIWHLTLEIGQYVQTFQRLTKSHKWQWRCSGNLMKLHFWIELSFQSEFIKIRSNRKTAPTASSNVFDIEFLKW